MQKTSKSAINTSGYKKRIKIKNLINIHFLNHSSSYPLNQFKKLSLEQRLVWEMIHTNINYTWHFAQYRAKWLVLTKKYTIVLTEQNICLLDTNAELIVDANFTKVIKVVYKLSFILVKVQNFQLQNFELRFFLSGLFSQK